MAALSLNVKFPLPSTPFATPRLILIFPSLEYNSLFPFPKWFQFVFLNLFLYRCCLAFLTPQFQQLPEVWPHFHLNCSWLLPNQSRDFRGDELCTLLVFWSKKIKHVQASPCLAWGGFQLLLKPVRFLFESFTGVGNKVPKSGGFTSNSSLGKCPVSSCSLGGQKKYPSEETVKKNTWTKPEQQRFKKHIL